jgi:hypothetical protein
MPNQNSLNNLDFETVKTIVFLSSGTYTPTVGMKYCIQETWGPGGGGAGSDVTTSIQFSAPGGGSGGNYAKQEFSASAIGVSKTVTIGAGGSGGAAGNNAGGNGGTTSTTSLTSQGGLGGNPMAATANSTNALGGLSNFSLSGTVNSPGNQGGTGFCVGGGSYCQSGEGGASFGRRQTPGIAGTLVSTSTPGNQGRANSGAGGSGALSAGGGAAAAGGIGGTGYVVITEFICA